MGISIKKLRGVSRYVRRLNSTANSFSVKLTDDNWFDLWHYHFDWHGYGRRDWALRQLHLKALFVAFERVLSQVQESGARLQVFVSIAPMPHADQDALYVHGQNPNGTPFSCQYAGVEWDVPPPSFLRPFVADRPWRVGLLTKDNQRWWVVRGFDGAAV